MDNKREIDILKIFDDAVTEALEKSIRTMNREFVKVLKHQAGNSGVCPPCTCEKNISGEK